MDRTSLIKGHLEMCVLSILSRQKSYGYEIMKELEKHNLKLKGVGSIYPILTKLSEQELVYTSRELTESGKVRVYYEINKNGQRALTNKIAEWLHLQNDIKSLLANNMKETNEDDYINKN
ncbi:PadR family transcriptional regulator [Bacillus timonensis]|uniref:PadR family transcriptional regulator n=1 Tax=Bacillus timonensis TaxID=1033734 RepID=A0A4S3PVP6_9BACI|nr:PadR family transcriptional regulator [Bacillus timonensis]THE13032.1 PadR family transcriptional regulator [Bacillus timonensis]